MINVINYAKALSTLKDDKYKGSFIGKIKFIKYDEETSEEIIYNTEEIKSSDMISIIEVTAFQNNIKRQKMIFVIALKNLRKYNACSMHREKSDERCSKKFFERFTEGEVEDFSRLVGDFNEIHLKGKDSIVQGMNILNELVKQYQINKDFQIKFLNPVYVNQSIYVVNEMNSTKIAGIYNDTLCFKLLLI